MGDYIADDIRRLLKSFVFRLFVHPLDCRGAASWGILIRCSWRWYCIVAGNMYCRWMPVGWPMHKFKASIAIETVDYLIFIFRCTIISKCILNIGYSSYVVIITYSLLLYYVFNRTASPGFPSLSVYGPLPSFLTITYQFCASFTIFYTIILITTPSHKLKLPIG